MSIYKVERYVDENGRLLECHIPLEEGGETIWRGMGQVIMQTPQGKATINFAFEIPATTVEEAYELFDKCGEEKAKEVGDDVVKQTQGPRILRAGPSQVPPASSAGGDVRGIIPG